MTVYLLRHAHAADRDAERYPEDRDRPLTAKGTSKLDRVLHRLREWKVLPEIIYSSPYLRCKQTAQRASQALGPQLQFLDCLQPGERFEDIALSLRDFETCMIVGHEPDLGELAGWLMTSQRAPLIELKKGGAACLSGPTVGHMRLQWLLAPRLIV